MVKIPFHDKNIQLLIENMWDAIYVANKEREIVYWSKSASELTGYAAEEVIGRQCSENLLAHHCDSTFLCGVSCPLKLTIQDGITREAQVSLLDKNGTSVPIFLRAIPYYDEHNEIIGAVEIFRKVRGSDEMSHLLQELNTLAYVEPLTGAARRNYGEAVLERALSSFSTSGSPFGILLLDLDRFKRINDTMGHLAGDHVLNSTASLIRQNLRSSDLLVRWGGDEFLVIIANSDAAVLSSLGNKLCTLSKNTRMDYNGTGVFVTLSVGGALPARGDTLTTLLERADKNLYMSKKKGRNRCTME